jgi:hypothetical protein
MAASSVVVTPRDIGMPFSKVQMEWDRRFEGRECILRGSNVIFLYPREIHQRVEVASNEAATQEDKQREQTHRANVAVPQLCADTHALIS